MAPKKDAHDGESNALLVGFTDKETKLLAAAFVSYIGSDKYNYDLMATLTGNTSGSLKKMWPPVKKKAIEKHPSFASLLGQAVTTATAAEPKTAKKRKASEETTEDDAVSENEKTDSNVKSPVAKKVRKAPAARGRARPKKEVKKEESEVDEDKVYFYDSPADTNYKKPKFEEDSANGDDGAKDEEA